MPTGYWTRIDTITVESEEERDVSAAGRLHFWHVAVDHGERKAADRRRSERVQLVVQRLQHRPALRWLFARRTAPGSACSATSGIPGWCCSLRNWCCAVFSCWRVCRLTRGDPAKRELRLYANALLTSLMVFAVGGNVPLEPVQRDVLALCRACQRRSMRSRCASWRRPKRSYLRATFGVPAGACLPMSYDGPRRAGVVRHSGAERRRAASPIVCASIAGNDYPRDAGRDHRRRQRVDGRHAGSGACGGRAGVLVAGVARLGAPQPRRRRRLGRAFSRS